MNSFLKVASLAALALCILGFPSSSIAAQSAQLTKEEREQRQAEFEDRVRLAAAVSELAFNPESFFKGEERKEIVLTVQYLGDDYGWPVLAIAIAMECVDLTANSETCSPRQTVRMVRSPAPADLKRERQRGSALIYRLWEDGARSRSSIRTRLTRFGVEWKEARLDQCPAAADTMKSSADLRWVPEEISHPAVQEGISIVLHADILDVRFRQYGRTSAYRGYIADGNPADWALKLVGALEPCWKDAAIAPPWR